MKWEWTAWSLCHLMKQSTVLGNKRLSSQSSSRSSNSHGCCVGWRRFGESSAACFPAFSAFTSKRRRRDSNGCGRESPRCVRRVDFQHLTLGSGSAITSAINKFPHAKQCQQWVCCFLFVRLFVYFFSPALLCLNAGVWLGLVIVDGLAGIAPVVCLPVWWFQDVAAGKQCLACFFVSLCVSLLGYFCFWLLSPLSRIVFAY